MSRCKRHTYVNLKRWKHKHGPHTFSATFPGYGLSLHIFKKKLMTHPILFTRMWCKCRRRHKHVDQSVTRGNACICLLMYDVPQSKLHLSSRGRPSASIFVRYCAPLFGSDLISNGCRTDERSHGCRSCSSLFSLSFIFVRIPRCTAIQIDQV